MSQLSALAKGDDTQVESKENSSFLSITLIVSPAEVLTLPTHPHLFLRQTVAVPGCAIKVFRRLSRQISR